MDNPFFASEIDIIQACMQVKRFESAANAAEALKIDDQDKYLIQEKMFKTLAEKVGSLRNWK